MGKVKQFLELGADARAYLELGRRAAAGDHSAVSGLPTISLSPVMRQNLTAYLKDPDAVDRRSRNVLDKYLIRASQEDSAWGNRERMRLSGVTEYSGGGFR